MGWIEQLERPLVTDADFQDDFPFVPPPKMKKYVEVVVIKYVVYYVISYKIHRKVSHSTVTVAVYEENEAKPVTLYVSP